MNQDYDVAISFAGEDRARAEELAEALAKIGVRVFYDANEKAELWGKDLYTHLTGLYQNLSQFCIILASQYYASKLWTTQERRAMQARAFSQDAEYILPVKLDDTDIPGILPTIAYLRWPPETASSIAQAVRFKLQQLKGAQTGAGPGSGSVGPNAPDPTIRQFQLSLDSIYGKVNRDRSLEYIYGYLSRTIGYLSKAVSQKQAVEKDFIRPLSWLFAIASKIGIEVEDAFSSRYPNICPSCVQGQCVCFKTGKKPPKYMPAYKVKEELQAARDIIINQRKPVTFDFAKGCIASIFPNNEIIWYYGGSGFHFSKIAEEVAEVHEAIAGLLTGKKKLGAVADEIADVLAWLLGAWHITLQEKSVDQELISYYINGCPVCQRNPCICRSYCGRTQNLFDAAVLTGVASDLAHLLDASPNDHRAIEELQKSIHVVIETQDDPLARLTLFQVALQLTRMKETQVGKSTASSVIPIISVILQKLERTYRQ